MSEIKTLAALAKLVAPVTNTEAQALWFLSLNEAQVLHEAYDRKDIAHMFREGIAPMAERWPEVLAGMAAMDSGRDWPTGIEVLQRADELGWF